jgi:hypothetical protein
LFIATAMLAVAAQPARAEAAAPGPVPAPYPNVSHKHIAGVKYEDLAKSDAVAAQADAGSLELNVEGVAWGQPDRPPVLNSADPMEGDQVSARTYHPGRPTFGNVTFDSATNSTSSSARMVQREPGKVEVPNIVAEPLARGTATVKTLAGLCATGKHLVKVKITTRAASFTLHDAIVTNVTPAGDGMDEVSLSYASLGD